MSNDALHIPKEELLKFAVSMRTLDPYVNPLELLHMTNQQKQLENCQIVIPYTRKFNEEKEKYKICSNIVQYFITKTLFPNCYQQITFLDVSNDKKNGEDEKDYLLKREEQGKYDSDNLKLELESRAAAISDKENSGFLKENIYLAKLNYRKELKLHNNLALKENLSNFATHSNYPAFFYKIELMKICSNVVQLEEQITQIIEKEERFVPLHQIVNQVPIASIKAETDTDEALKTFDLDSNNFYFEFKKIPFDAKDMNDLSTKLYQFPYFKALEFLDRYATPLLVKTIFFEEYYVVSQNWLGKVLQNIEILSKPCEDSIKDYYFLTKDTLIYVAIAIGTLAMEIITIIEYALHKNSMYYEKHVKTVWDGRDDQSNQVNFDFSSNLIFTNQYITKTNVSRRQNLIWIMHKEINPTDSSDVNFTNNISTTSQKDQDNTDKEFNLSSFTYRLSNPNPQVKKYFCTTLMDPVYFHTFKVKPNQKKVINYHTKNFNDVGEQIEMKVFLDNVLLDCFAIPNENYELIIETREDLAINSNVDFAFAPMSDVVNDRILPISIKIGQKFQTMVEMEDKSLKPTIATIYNKQIFNWERLIEYLNVDQVPQLLVEKISKERPNSEINYDRFIRKYAKLRKNTQEYNARFYSGIMPNYESYKRADALPGFLIRKELSPTSIPVLSDIIKSQSLIPYGLCSMETEDETWTECSHVVKSPFEMSHDQKVKLWELTRLELISFPEILDLSYNIDLVEISGEICNLPLESLNLDGCPALRTPPREVVNKGLEFIQGYMRKLLEGSNRCRKTKLILVGLGGAGKTSLVNRMMNDTKEGSTDTNVTDGIIIKKWLLQSVEYSVWDFAGQTIYYNTHQFFLSNRAIYILLWNVRLGYEYAGLNFWLNTIGRHAPNAPILLVGSHIDEDGRILHDDLTKVWPTKTYPIELHSWLITLMEEFNLLFSLKSQKEYLIPCLLPPFQMENFWEGDVLTEQDIEKKMVYEFDYLPLGLFNRAQVRLHYYSDELKLWSDGSFLQKNEHRGFIKKTDSSKVIVKVRGPRPDNILFFVHEVFERLIEESFSGVKYDYFLSCIECVRCRESRPSMVPSERIRKALNSKIPLLQCFHHFHILTFDQLQNMLPPKVSDNLKHKKYTRKLINELFKYISIN
ncbi:DgyrCDS3176 [Dimorphilus gyrociliatus]|uniref:DgyrCDS3176 n=1 Tax=Dimorphilus gyrociliatus TaxID=2664684 RepID=A0A7I8VHG5_9ANNE|nr:DgyrCDS3176 [Dimorphilus gyrociliatus]